MGDKSKGKGIDIKTIGLAVAVSVIGSIILAAILASLIVNGRIDETRGGILACVLWLFAGAIGGLVGRGSAEEKKIYGIVVVSCAIACMYLIGGMLLFEGAFVRVLHTPVLIAVGCILPYTIGMRKRKEKYRRHIRTR